MATSSARTVSSRCGSIDSQHDDRYPVYVSYFNPENHVDLDPYYGRIIEVLNEAGAIIEVSAKPLDHLVQEHKQRVGTSFGFIGIYSYYYGPIPDKFSESIQHLEYKCACQQFHDESSAKMMSFLPEENTDFSEMLQRTVENYLGADDDPAFHRQKSKAFHDEVKMACRHPEPHYLFFDSRKRLEHLVKITYLSWTHHLINIAQSQVDAKDTNPNRDVIELHIGKLGRRRQIEAIEHLHSDLTRGRSDGPAAALVVYGDEYAAQMEFSHQLTEHLNIFGGRKPTSGQPNTRQYRVEVLPQWIAENLGLLAEGVRTPEQLANLVWRELNQQSLTLVIDNIQNLIGGLPVFHRAFWKPFFQAFPKVIPDQKDHRLLVVLMSNQPKLDILHHERWLQRYVEPGEGGGSIPYDYSKLIALPQLDIIHDTDLEDWLERDLFPDLRSEARPVPTVEAVLAGVSALRNDENRREQRASEVYDHLRFNFPTNRG